MRENRAEVDTTQRVLDCRPLFGGVGISVSKASFNDGRSQYIISAEKTRQLD